MHTTNRHRAVVRWSINTPVGFVDTPSSSIRGLMLNIQPHRSLTPSKKAKFTSLILFVFIFLPQKPIKLLLPGVQKCYFGIQFWSPFLLSGRARRSSQPRRSRPTHSRWHPPPIYKYSNQPNRYYLCRSSFSLTKFTARVHSLPPPSLPSNSLTPKATPKAFTESKKLNLFSSVFF